MTTTFPAEVAAADTAAVGALCARWGTSWNNHDGDAVAALCSEDLVYDEPALKGTVRGRDAIRDFVADTARDYPDFSFTLTGLYAEVSRRAVLVAWRFAGTHAATGRPVEFHGDDRLELGEDGLIHAYRCLYDYKFVLSQIA